MVNTVFITIKYKRGNKVSTKKKEREQPIHRQNSFDSIEQKFKGRSGVPIIDHKHDVSRNNKE